MRDTQALLVLGIMSGTSMDSVDYALCHVQHQQVRLLEFWQKKYPARLRARLQQAAQGLASSWETGQLHHDLGRFYAAHAQPPISRYRPQLIGLHGQTVFHQPDRSRPATLQLGEPAYLAERSKVPVIANFRAADIAAGGQGAPLATLFHKIVFARRKAHICINNLGGISNVTSIDWTQRAAPRILAFDTGPANLLLDLAVRQLTRNRQSCDWNGKLAAAGTPSVPLVKSWLRHPFFRQTPPKSTGRELFGERFLQQRLSAMRSIRLSVKDVLSTLTEFTAQSIARNYQLHLPGPPDQVILTGGGAANPELVRRITAALPSRTRVLRSIDFGWPAQTIEPAAFALLAYYRWRGLPANLPQTTGATRPVLLGQLVEP